MGAIFNVFPLILIPVLTYNIWAFGATAASNDGGASVRQHLADRPVEVLHVRTAEQMRFDVFITHLLGLDIDLEVDIDAAELLILLVFQII